MANIYETIRVLFTEDLDSLDMMFKTDIVNWGVASLKEWCESYETTRFTAISEKEVVITSEYNMLFVKDWIKQNVPIKHMVEIL